MSSLRRVVVTGGPGSGKTSLLDALGADGFATSPEAGRKIIRHQVRIGGQGLPWVNPALFAELMLQHELEAYEAATASGAGTVIFDRGVPDVAGYLRLCGLTVPPHIEQAAQDCRYDLIFIAPFWPEIFTQDDERKQDLEEAKSTSEVMAATYARLGYRVIELPKVSVAERVAFLRTHLKETFGEG